MAASDEFKHFDVVSNDAAIDNHFYSGPTSVRDDYLYPIILKEREILEKHLPDSIFVRTYKNHIDLLRAAIVGPAGTPYHDGLFFFDLQLTEDYPWKPPKVHFHSHGLRLNPDLHSSGTVYLSLLNTWFGKDYERWNPYESTILQVLLSIQALVFNSKPFLNDPLARRIFGPWESLSRVYNENAFICTCKTTAFLMRKPPRCFEDVVVAHFRRRAGAVLGACRAYAEGRVRVGGYNIGGREMAADNGKKGDVSRRFRRSFKRAYEELVKEFRARGILVEGVAEVLEVKTTASEGGRNSNNGIVKRFVKKMKMVFGLKKENTVE